MRKGRAVAAVALLTVATQIKVYPAVIAVILLVRLGWRPLIGYVVANLALLFVLGVSGFDNFVTLLAKISGSPYIWPGNHSLHAFVNYLAQNGLIPTESESLVRLGCYAGILLLFSAAAVKYVYVMMKLKSAAVTDHRRKTFSPIELGIIGMSFSMMSLLPSVSHDYKLSIQIVPFLLLLNGLSDDSFGRRVEVLTLIAILATCVAYLFIPRYVPFGLYLPDPASRDLIQSKTPGVIVAFACYLYLTVRGGVAMEEREISRGEA